MSSSENNNCFGSYGILVPNEIDCVVAEDGYNYMYKDGSITERICHNPFPMNDKIYKQKYAKEDNGKWYNVKE